MVLQIDPDDMLKCLNRKLDHYENAMDIGGSYEEGRADGARGIIAHLQIYLDDIIDEQIGDMNV